MLQKGIGESTPVISSKRFSPFKTQGFAPVALVLSIVVQHSNNSPGEQLICPPEGEVTRGEDANLLHPIPRLGRCCRCCSWCRLRLVCERIQEIIFVKRTPDFCGRICKMPKLRLRPEARPILYQKKIGIMIPIFCHNRKKGYGGGFEGIMIHLRWFRYHAVIPAVAVILLKYD
jgi:hypothetical protein